MDATMSRQPTWDLALGLQADMFRAVKEVGGLDVQLVYFRGYGETRASKWVSDPEALARLMTRVSCQGGYTQIRKVLTHARRESEQAKVNAMVYVGDCMEEDIDELSQRAGALGLMGVQCMRPAVERLCETTAPRRTVRLRFAFLSNSADLRCQFSSPLQPSCLSSLGIVLAFPLHRGS
jgi:hypothetical protein